MLGLENVALAEDGAGETLSERVAAFERAVISDELARSGGRMKETYERLGLSRKALYDKIRRYGLERD